MPRSRQWQVCLEMLLADGERVEGKTVKEMPENGKPLVLLPAEGAGFFCSLDLMQTAYGVFLQCRKATSVNTNSDMCSPRW